ncbi:PREDICTED: uncharacterized protein LOC105568628 [Vollenhovia emeryi]|uniref:uncharacterized protein LOC105568628 n=1 Tax=Vollenhovia emeryi TaxID=411798 RepID=UPI0005F3E08B|nr:PREDICTED: uncharacterized protein LOC105568628 [Vollenhovia emeryi]
MTTSHAARCQITPAACDENEYPEQTFRVVTYLAQHNIATLPQPPYSPDVAPPDFFLFPRLKTALKGNDHGSVEALQQAVTRELNSIPAAAFQEAYEGWKSRCQRYTFKPATENVRVNAEFKKQLFKEIHLIHLKLNDLMSNVDILIKKVRCTDEPQLYDDTNAAVKTLIQSFPVTTEQQLMLMEEWLSSSADNIQALSHQLRLIGGVNLSHVIKSVMSRVISNEVGMLYSWEGVRQKKSF